MAAGAVGHEIKLLGTRRVGGGLDRGAAGIGDRPGRQTVDEIGVVGRRLGELTLGERMAERALAVDQAIDDRRVGLQLHLLLEPINEHRGNPRALLRLAGFLLDDRGQDHELVRRLERQIGAAALPHLSHQPVLRLAHALKHLLAREAAVEMIAVGQQAAFARNVLDVAREDLVLQQPRDDLLGGEPFRHGEGVLHDLAVDDGLQDIAHARMLGEDILASLELGARLHGEHAADEDQAVLVDDPFALEQVGNLHHSKARRDDDDLVIAQRPRRLEAALANDRDTAAHDQRQHQQGEDGVAHDHQRIAGAPRRTSGSGTRGKRHVVGLQGGARTARRDTFGLRRGSGKIRISQA